MYTIAYTTRENGMDGGEILFSNILRVTWRDEDKAAHYCDVMLANYDDVDSAEVIYIGED